MSPGTINTIFSECVSSFHLAISSDENFHSECSAQQSFLRSSLGTCKEHACSNRANVFQLLNEVCELLACNSSENESLRLQSVNNGWDIYVLDDQKTGKQTWVFPIWAVILTSVLGSVCVSVLVGTVAVSIYRRISKGRKEQGNQRSDTEGNREQPNVVNVVESGSQTENDRVSSATIVPYAMYSPNNPNRTIVIDTETTLSGSDAAIDRMRPANQTNAHGSGNETTPR